MQLADHIRKARQIQNKLSHPSCAVVIVAAGSSARMGGTDKILAELGGLPSLSLPAKTRCRKSAASARHITRCASSSRAGIAGRSR